MMEEMKVVSMEVEMRVVKWMEVPSIELMYQLLLVFLEEYMLYLVKQLLIRV